MSNGKWESRIVGFAEVPPDQLLANPLNARRHPARQRDALRASLDRIGWVAPVIVNQRTGMMVDGHARVEEALSAGLDAVPVLTIDVSPEDERVMLATFDPISMIADTDREVLDALLEGLELPDSLGQVIGLLTGEAQDSARHFTNPEVSIVDVDEMENEMKHVCPRCQFSWQ